MKRQTFPALVVVALLLLPAIATRAATPTHSEIAQASNWARENFSTSWPRGKLPPFSFVYGGRRSNDLLRNWKFTVGPVTHHGAVSLRSLSYTDPATGLKLTCKLTRYSDFPAVEWVLIFQNTGPRPTPILGRVKALDVQLKSEGESVLHRALGSSAKATDFSPIDQSLHRGDNVALAPVGGRSSNTTALPFFNLQAAAAAGRPARTSDKMSESDDISDGGAMIAIGWSGEWSANFGREDSGVRIQAGMQLTRLKLLPGERIRTPRILLLFWHGSGFLRGDNLLRSFLLAHHTPRPGGHLPVLPIAASGWFQFDKGNNVTQKNQIQFASQYFKKRIPIDAFWLDAGWFKGGWPNGVGNWFVKKQAFPHGLRPLSDAVHHMGMRFIVWFEPERVHKGTWLATHHPDWLLGKGDNMLLNLGNPQARQWLTNYISRMIKRDRIDIYRQDFNINPLPFWRNHDAPDRQGITEIRYVEGLYRFWDDLLKQNPNLLIDNCASGGRRIDLETISRSVPLWRTDYNGAAAGRQAQGVGLGLYVPLSGTGIYPVTISPSNVVDTYRVRSAMGAGFVLSWNVESPQFKDALVRRLVETEKQIRKFYYGNLYPLTKITTQEDTWLAYQCDRPDLGEGMVMAFRRRQAASATLEVKLHGLKPEAIYTLTEVDSNRTWRATGKQLSQGLRLNISTTPGSALLVYKMGKLPMPFIRQ